ncbi:hypothetical protein HGP17_14380 [Rhizobium sp. P38BS-XIX]|uniref:hypothetical protein n=1 Tax=Rhizobium sp. P38BS-XIX TaxID=2726740 RepID=UPI0014571E81|nr:hypothetical protein [Rhizobium sp. P38BS-XIX]NLR98003.1 hypothetical protein [Rhizobium sp. P38BS-XIX]
MGEVIQFRPAKLHARHMDPEGRIERELQLPFVQDAKHRPRPNANLADTDATASSSKIRIPFNGIAIVVGSILVYALVISHVVGQPHYSVRAHYVPSAFVGN